MHGHHFAIVNDLQAVQIHHTTKAFKDFGKINKGEKK
jgi:hypothetical protein